MANQDDAEQARHDRIEQHAYRIYQRRGGQHGLDVEDWEQAELEVDGLKPSDDSLPHSEEEERRDD